MGLEGKLEIEVEIQSSADEFYNVWRNQAYHLPNASDAVQNVHLHEGEWHSKDAVKLWNYTLEGKLEVEIDIQSSADEFYNLFKSQIYHLPTISSDLIQKVELHDGDWSSSDAVKHWNYTLDGKALTAKEKVDVDDENKSITFNIMEGDILKEFKSFKATGQATAKADGSGSTVKWTLDYEKLNEAVAEPKSYTDAIIKITKDVDAHLLNA